MASIEFVLMITTCHRYVLPLISAAALGCSTAQTAPEDRDLDVVALRDGLDRVRDVFTSERWADFAAHTKRIAFPQPPAQPNTVATESVAQRTEIVPPAYLGVTLALDEALREYLPDPLQTGAPADGARFVLYEVDPQSGDLVAGAEQGYADVRDPGAGIPDGFAVSIEVLFSGEPFANYTTSFGAAPLRSSTVAAFDHIGLDIHGSVASPQNEVDTEALSGNGDGVKITEFAMGLAGGTFAISGTILGDPQTGDYSLSLALQDGTDRLRMEGGGTASTFSGTVGTGDQTFAAIEMTGGAVSVTGADGAALPSDEQALIRAWFEFAVGVPGLLDALVIAAL